MLDLSEISPQCFPSVLSERKELSVERLMRRNDGTVTRRLAVTNDGQRLRRRTCAEDVPRVVQEHLHNAESQRVESCSRLSLAALQLRPSSIPRE